MRRFRSFISSSETLRIDTAEPQWQPALRVVVLAALVLLAGELSARFLLAKHGRSWEYWHPVAAAKFEFIRSSMASGRPIRTLVVGDSTGARDIDPEALEKQTGPIAWNGAWSGNFPLAFERTTLPLLMEQSLNVEFVVASFIPSGFGGGDRLTPSEAGIVGSAFVQRQSAGWLTGDYLHLARLRTAWPFLLGEPEGLDDSVRQYGFEPDGGRLAQDAVDQTARTSTAFALSDRRVSVMKGLVAASRERGFTLVVADPPTRDPRRIPGAEIYIDRLHALAREEGGSRMVVIDYTKAPFLDVSHFSDLNHLNAEGARVLSSDIGRRLSVLSARAKQVRSTW